MEEEIAGAWEGKLLQPEDLGLPVAASPPVGQSTCRPVRMPSSPPAAAASVPGTSNAAPGQYVPPPPPTSPPLPQPAASDRPNLVLRDFLTAVQHAQPIDIHVIVEHLTQQYRCRHTPRELALILSGVFVGRQGFARELRDLALTSGLHGLPANVVLTTALTYMEACCGMMSDEQLW